MAIKIPSNKIYSIKNKRILNNVIDEIDINATNVYSIYKKDDVVAVQELPLSNIKNTRKTNNASKTNQDELAGRKSPYYEIDNIIIGRLYTISGSFSVPKKSIDKTIVNANVNSTADERCYTIRYAESEITATGKLKPKIDNLGNLNYETPNPNTATEKSPEEQGGEPSTNSWYVVSTKLGKSTEKSGVVLTAEEYNAKKVVFENTVGVGTGGSAIESTAKVEYSGSDVQESFTLTENVDDYTITYKIVCGKEWFYLTNIINESSYVNTCYTNSSGNVTSAKTRELSGKGISIFPRSIELQLFGNSYEVKIDESAIKIGNGNNVFKVSGNELLQNRNTYGDNSAEFAINKMFNKTKNAYANGKETITLTCLIDNYYDYDTNEKIKDITNANAMIFDIGDEVIPMILTGNNGVNVEKPISLKAGDSPKIFKVVASKITYNGAPYQELSLQEI